MAWRSCVLAMVLALSAIARVQAEPRVLQVIAPWAVTSLEPTETGYIATRLGIAETLVGVEPDGRLVGLVAESWSVSADRLSWRFRLRAGRRFHDGSPVTAQAVVASLERGRLGAETLATVPFAAIAAEGEDVVIATTRPFATLPAFLTDWGGVILAPASFAPDGRTVGWIGSGPYKVVGRDGDRVLDLAAVDTGHAGPKLARVRYTAVAQGETRAAMLEAGDADLAFTLLPSAAARIGAGKRARVDSQTIPRVRMLSFNLDLPMFADLATRQAISLGIDRIGIATAILRHPPSAASQLFPPMLAGWHDPALPVPARDLGAARAKLAEAGWRPGPDGVLVRAGAAFRFTLLTVANRPELPPIAAALQAQLRELGIAVDIRVGTGGAVPQAHRDGSLQASLTARTYVNVPDPIGTVLTDFASRSTIWASEGWDNPELRALADAYTATFESDLLPALRARIGAIVQAELPVIAVSWYENSVGISPRLRDVRVDPYETRYLIERMDWSE